MFVEETNKNCRKKAFNIGSHTQFIAHNGFYFHRHVIGSLLRPHSCHVRKHTWRSWVVTGVQASSHGIDITRKSLPRYKTFHRKEHEIWCFSTWARLFTWPSLLIEAQIFIRDRLRLRSSSTQLQSFSVCSRSKRGDWAHVLLWLCFSRDQVYRITHDENLSENLQRLAFYCRKCPPYHEVELHSRNIITKLHVILVKTA